MDDLYSLAETEKIKVDFFDFGNTNIKGIYYVDDNMPPTIGLDVSLKNNTPLFRSVFAEELGHHFTSAGFGIPRQFYNYSERLVIDRIEYKALRWAANYLIPENDLLDALRDCIETQSELAEHFRVVPEIIKIRLKLFEKNLY